MRVLKLALITGAAIVFAGCGGGGAIGGIESEVRPLAQKYIDACNQNKIDEIIAMSTEETKEYIKKEKAKHGFRCDSGVGAWVLSPADKPIISKYNDKARGMVPQAPEGSDHIVFYSSVPDYPIGGKREVRFVKDGGQWKYYTTLVER